MSLDRRSILSLCLGSLFIMAGAAFIGWSRWDKLSHGLPPLKEKGALPDTFDPSLNAGGTGWPAPGPKHEEAHAAAPLASTTPAPSTPAPEVAPVAPPTPPAAAAKRNILFSYRNSKASKVAIVGSFNNWTPAPMTSADKREWSLSVSLDPGEYTYNFLVDGKPVRDPNNAHTAPEGRSLLVVTPRNQ
jgi:hypothetical protein